MHIQPEVPSPIHVPCVGVEGAARYETQESGGFVSNVSDGTLCHLIDTEGTFAQTLGWLFGLPQEAQLLLPVKAFRLVTSSSNILTITLGASAH